MEILNELKSVKNILKRTSQLQFTAYAIQLSKSIVALCTTKFNVQHPTFCSHHACVRFVRISENPDIISLHTMD